MAPIYFFLLRFPDLEDFFFLPLFAASSFTASSAITAVFSRAAFAAAFLSAFFRFLACAFFRFLSAFLSNLACASSVAFSSGAAFAAATFISTFSTWHAALHFFAQDGPGAVIENAPIKAAQPTSRAIFFIFIYFLIPVRHQMIRDYFGFDWAED